MSIAVSVQNWKFTARHNSCGVRQESAPQSATAYSFETLEQANKRQCDGQ